KKTAERIVLELQDKLSHYAVESSSLQDRIEVLPASSQEEDSVLALVSLGFSKQEAGDAVTKAVAANKKLADAGDIVKAALSYL
ncbi:MAG: hypothetical protein KDD70_12685, partial [Bdellovibrionales bacterium]|nr:hypothetical protein [Bdellovibrionales bacterium]